MPARTEKKRYPHAAFCDRYGPWALVAGASKGIGAAFAELLAERRPVATRQFQQI
jgi:hypothetical protein